MTSKKNVMSAKELKGLLDSERDVFVLDVRNDDEFDEWRVEGKNAPELLHIPYFDFIEEPDVQTQRVPKDKDVVVVCAKGGASDYVAELLRERGYRAYNLDGGMIAWGSAHQPVSIPMGRDRHPAMVAYQINRFGKGCLSYLIGSDGEAVVVDPSRSIDEYLRLADAEGLAIKYVFDTHLHADHLSGGRLLAEKLGIPYLIQSADAEGARFSFEPLRDGQSFRVGSMDVRVIALATPGHTPGSTTLLAGDVLLLTGDTLFVDGVGRPDLGGMAEPWARSLYRTLFEKLADVPDDVWILPAHYSSPKEQRSDGLVTAELGELRNKNIALKSRSEDDFVEFILSRIADQPEIYQEIRKANLGVLAIDEDHAQEMELGKNQCAAEIASART